MKYKTTAKAVREGYSTIISIGYCEAQYLLKNQCPVAYTYGIYGWNFDVFEVEDVAIVTGYRPIKGISLDYTELKELDQRARGVSAEEVDKLLVAWVKRVRETHEQKCIKKTNRYASVVTGRNR